MNDREITKKLEEMEAITREKPESLSKDDFDFAVQFITDGNNAQKRESSRIVGNVAAVFPDEMDKIIPKLLLNTKDDGTVIRWSAAYALGRIIATPKYAKSDLFGKVTKLAAVETENGIKNQYLVGLKKAEKQRGK
ncbi:MAG: HEAT repeat domain-containing protein [Candidatus Nomurabacteria bacterium]|jgi:hypothetical protein|nr:HEAT repeat domain-containing protein [Candidatus Nomurabacteria bacterium]